MRSSPLEEDVILGSLVDEQPVGLYMKITAARPFASQWMIAQSLW